MLVLQNRPNQLLKGAWHLLAALGLFCLVVGCAGQPKKLIQLPPRFQISDVVVLSGLYKDQVIYTVEQHRPEITACYMGALRGRDEFKAKFVMRFIIEPNGVVRSAGVDGKSTNDKAFGSCVVAKLKACRFPALDVPAVTEVPVFTLDFFPPTFP